MKKLAVLFLITIMVLPLQVFAKKIELKDYKTLDLKQTLKDDEIDISYKDYKETDDQVTIYLFRGKGCGYCHRFLLFLDSITEEYGKYFKLVSFEVWYDKDNQKLMEELSKFMGNEAKGVPYIIIGDKVFPGYAASYDEEIKKTITDLYNTKKTNRYDVFKEYNKKQSKSKSSSTSSVTAIVINSIVTLAAAGAVIIYVDRSNKTIKELILNETKTKKTK